MKRELRGRGGRGLDARRAEEGWCKRVKIRNEKTRERGKSQVEHKASIFNMLTAFHTHTNSAPKPVVS